MRSWVHGVKRLAASAGAILVMAAGCGSADDLESGANDVTTSTATSIAVATTPTTVPPTTVPPTTVPSTTVPSTTVPSTTTTTRPLPPRVLLVGDSTLLAVESYGTEAGLVGFDPSLEVASCRTLGVPSCGDEPKPPNSVETITTADGPFDGIVIMAGYDEWWTTFPESLDEVLTVSRSQGASWILWLNYPENVPYLLPDGRSANEAFSLNNETLRAAAEQPENSDLILADWASYSSLAPWWIGNDGIHLSPQGAFGVADYISRWVAHLSGTECPVPLEVAGPMANPCMSPDLLETVPDIGAVYSE